MTPELTSSLSLLAPELVIALGAMVLLMIGAYSSSRSYSTVNGLAVLLLVAAGAWTLFWSADGEAFAGAFVSDPFARFMKLLTLVGSALTLVMSTGFAREQKFDKFEYPVLVLLATLGMLLMISANDMIALYLGLELQSLSLYVVAAINRDSLRSTEAGLKYFVLGALSSGMLLYGISLVYGYTGSTGFEQIAAALGSGDWSSCSPACPSRSPRCRSTCGRLTSTKARRRRSLPSSPLRRRWRRWRSPYASSWAHSSRWRPIGSRS
jgi:NADH-quinone oxidoreductase subunit N